MLSGDVCNNAARRESVRSISRFTPLFCVNDVKSD